MNLFTENLWIFASSLTDVIFHLVNLGASQLTCSKPVLVPSFKSGLVFVTFGKRHLPGSQGQKYSLWKKIMSLPPSYFVKSSHSWLLWNSIDTPFILFQVSAWHSQEETPSLLFSTAFKGSIPAFPFLISSHPWVYISNNQMNCHALIITRTHFLCAGSCLGTGLRALCILTC